MRQGGGLRVCSRGKERKSVEGIIFSLVTIQFVSTNVSRSDQFWLPDLPSESYEATFPILTLLLNVRILGLFCFFSKRKERIKGGSHSHIPNILGWRAQSLIKKVDTRSALCFTYGGGAGSGWSIVNKLIGTVPTWPRFVEIWWEKAMISTQTQNTQTAPT